MSVTVGRAGGLERTDVIGPALDLSSAPVGMTPRLTLLVTTPDGILIGVLNAEDS